MPIADSHLGWPPAVVCLKEVLLPNQLQNTSKDESLCCLRDCDCLSSDHLVSSVDWIFSSGCDEQCNSVPLRGGLRKSTAYICLEKYCNVAELFHSNCGSLDPICGFYSDCAEKENEKR